MGTLLFITIVVLPGVLTALLMIRYRSPEWFESRGPAVWFIPLPAGFMVVSAIMELLEFMHRLSLNNVLAGSAMFTGMAGVMLWRRPGRLTKNALKHTVGKRLIWPVAALAVYMALTVYPFDFVFETTDSGVYVTSGIQAFKSGSYRFTDPELPATDTGFHWSFYHVTPQDQYDNARKFHFEGIMGTGFFIRSFDTGLIEPRYYNLHPFWIGLFVQMFGLEPGVWLATPFAALCGISGVFLLVWALAGWVTASLTVSLLSIFVLQIWFGRYITTEMPMQAAIMNGLAWLLLFGPGRRDHRSVHSKSGTVSRGYGIAMVCSGIMLAMSHFARIDSILLLPAITVAAALWLCFSDSLQAYIVFMIAYGGVTAAAVVMAMTRFHCYTMETLQHVSFDAWTPMHWIAAVSAALLGGVPCLLIRRHRYRVAAMLRKRARVVWTVLLSGIAAAVLYGYFIRPVIHPPDYAAFHAADANVKSYSLNQMTLRWLGWYLSPPGFLAAAAGLILLLRRKWTVQNAAVWTVTGIYMVYFMHKIHCTPYHYWGMRRYITVVLPVLFAGLGYVIVKALQFAKEKRSHLITAVIIAAVAAQTIFQVYNLRLVFRFNNWEGAIDTLESICEVVPEKSTRLILPRYPGIYIYMPLRLIFNRQAYLLHWRPDSEIVLASVKQWLRAGDRVFYMSDRELPVSDITDLERSNGLILTPAAHERPRFPLLRYTVEHPPEKHSVHGFEYWIYEIGSGDGAASKK